MKHWKFDKRKCRNGEFRAVLRSANGEIVLNLESYQRKSGLDNGIESIRLNGQIPSNYKRMTAKDGKPYFNLVAANNKVIGTSETYDTFKAMEDTIFAMTLNVFFAQEKENYSWWNFSFETVYGTPEEL